MFLNDIATLGANQKFQRLKRTLKRDHSVDLSPYYDLSESEISDYIVELDIRAKAIILEGDFGGQYQNPEYVRATLLSEACKMILQEIRPKRSKKNKTNETLDFKVDEPTGVAVDHVTGNYPEETEEARKERPDLYWRRQQWRKEQEEANPTVVANGENSPLGNHEQEEVSLPYATNHTPDPTRTPEDEQEAGVYVGVMDPDRFLGSDDQEAIHVEPSVSTVGFQNSDLSSVSTTANGKKTVADLGVQDEINSVGLKKIIAVYEDDEDMNDVEAIAKLGKLLENTLLQEGELERAELVMAMRDLTGRIQKQLEDVAKYATDDIMPLTGGLRTYYSEEMADQFAAKSEASLQAVADSLQATKDIFEDYGEVLEQRISDEDSGKPTNDMMGDEMGGMDDMGDMGDEMGGMDDMGDMGDEMGGMGDELGSDLDAELDGALDGGPEEIEPLGRARKESYENKKAVIVELAGSKVRLTENQVNSLMFAKKFYEKTSMMGAKSVRVSESQNVMLENAKRIMSKLNKGKK